VPGTGNSVSLLKVYHLLHTSLLHRKKPLSD
jgi:hypothetical protein